MNKHSRTHTAEHDKQWQVHFLLCEIWIHVVAQQHNLQHEFHENNDYGA